MRRGRRGRARAVRGSYGAAWGAVGPGSVPSGGRFVSGERCGGGNFAEGAPFPGLEDGGRSGGEEEGGGPPFLDRDRHPTPAASAPTTTTMAATARTRVEVPEGIGPPFPPPGVVLFDIVTLANP